MHDCTWQVRDLSTLITLVGSLANTALAMLPLVIHARLLLTLDGFRATSSCQAPTPLTRGEKASLAVDALAALFCIVVMVMGVLPQVVR
jgi:hypothetical protein